MKIRYVGVGYKSNIWGVGLAKYWYLLWEGKAPSNVKQSGVQLMLTDGSSAPGAAVKKAK